MKVLINNIIIGERQRIDLGNIDELADSMQRNGQIHNIGLTPDLRLIWGRRRLAAATKLGWIDIEAVIKEGLSYHDEQVLELEEDLKRKDRTWQERCLATEKLYRLKKVSVRELAEYLGEGKSTIAYLIEVAEALHNKDEQVWKATSQSEALQILTSRRAKEAQDEIERRRVSQQLVAKQVEELKKTHAHIFESATKPASHVQNMDTTPLKKLSLQDRANLCNKAYEHLGPPNTPLFYIRKAEREFITAFWFVGGANINELYGGYQIEYLKRINVLFPDSRRVIHLFSGNIPPSNDYLRVGLPQGDTKPDIECDAHELSSRLPFKPDLIYADPPYSVEDSEHYANSMVNRERVIQECAIVLEPGGFLVWLDQAMPLFSNNDLQFVGAISYLRSTGNRFRVVSIFRKPLCQNTTSTPASDNTSSPNPQVSSPQAPTTSTGA